MLSKQLKTLKVYELAPRLKHATVFEWFNALMPGESFILKNDHDPKPLYYQMLGELGPVFSWEYNEQGPEWWQVTLGKNELQELTIGDIAAKDFRKAKAMQRLGIDFCCGGNKTIDQAVSAAGISAEALRQALQEAELDNKSTGHRFDQWEAGFLVDYIYNQHHNYFYAIREGVLQLVTKVSAAHGSSHPELYKLGELVEQLFVELTAHFQKEETLLFPYIKALADSQQQGTCAITDNRLTKGLLSAMHMEHDVAGELLKAMRASTNDYTIPDGACHSFRLLYTQLEELETDLHQHIHLENNILLPKALQLEKAFVH